ncbi:MAG TPA: alpha-amylase family glycosyl hydrolase [Flavisolibacter sp.]
MKRLLLLVAALWCGLLSYSQLLTWTPAFPKETETITITVDATKGNQGLLGFTGNAYVHLGAITNLSTGPANWLHEPFTWGSTEVAAQATPAGTNKWTYTINNPRTFFNLAAGEELKHIAILFRQGNCTTCTAQRNTDGSDMYIPIYTNNLAVRLSQPPREPKYVPTPEPQTWTVGTNFSISADANKPSAMKLYHNGTVIATSAGNVTTLSGNSSVTVGGNQQIVAEAADGSATKYDTINIFVTPTTIPVAPLPAGVQDGINYISPTSVTLVLRAPGKNLVTVAGDFNNWLQTVMTKTPDGKFFWITLNGLTAGTEYAFQYVADGTIKVADPYAEKILDPSNDPSITSATYPNLKTYPSGQSGMVSVFQTQQPAYNWAVNNFTKQDKRGLVIYELLTRDFIAAHDWKTLKDTLSYLKKLGVNAIEVMPWTEFEGNLSWGYNTFQYFAPDKYYGPKNTLKEFIDSCHKNGFAVIMDVVLNHTYGPSPLRDLYWNPQSNRPANNPWYNPVAPHAFGFGEDFNHESPDTKYFFNRVLQHWVTEYKIDGYRFDFSKGLTQKPSSDDGAFSAYDATRIAIINGYVNTIKAIDPNSYIILEHFCADNEEKELADNGMMLWSNVWTQYQEASMGHLPNSNFDRVIHTTKGFNSPHLVGFMESHDEERIVYKNIRYGNASGSYNVRDTATALKRMELNAAFLLTIPGPKMIWQFGELGYDISRCYQSSNADESGNCDKKTEAKPIRWDYKAEARRQQVYNTYSELNRLRNHPWYKGVFQSATIERSLSGGFKWIKLISFNDTADLVVIGNFDVVPQTGSVTFPTGGNWYDYFGNFIQPATGSAQNFTLQPGEFHVYINRNVNNVVSTPVTNVPWNGATLEAKLYPNPLVGTAYSLEIKIPQSGKTIVELYNSVGQFVSTVYNGFLTNGTRVLSLPHLQKPSGIYFLKVRTKDLAKTISLTLQ